MQTPKRYQFRFVTSSCLLKYWRISSCAITESCRFWFAKKFLPSNSAHIFYNFRKRSRPIRFSRWSISVNIFYLQHPNKRKNIINLWFLSRLNNFMQYNAIFLCTVQCKLSKSLLLGIEKFCGNSLFIRCFRTSWNLFAVVTVHSRLYQTSQRKAISSCSSGIEPLW